MIFKDKLGMTLISVGTIGMIGCLFFTAITIFTDREDYARILGGMTLGTLSGVLVTVPGVMILGYDPFRRELSAKQKQAILEKIESLSKK